MSTDLEMRQSVSARACRALVLTVVIGLFAVNVYRAATQSLTCDEAYTYELYWHAPLKQVFLRYDANNHVLNTLLERLTVRTFGLSELALRLPALLGGALYLFCVLQLCRKTIRNRWISALGVLSLTLNPFLLDYLSAARGYGLGLGFFIAALCVVVPSSDKDAVQRERSDPLVGVLLGLSISASLVFIIPCVAFATVLTLMRSVGLPGTGRPWLRLARAAKTLWAPMTALSILFLAVPLSHATRKSFYYGEPTLRRAAFSLVSRIFFHSYDVWAPPPPRIEALTDSVTDWCVPAILAVILLALSWIVLRRIGPNRTSNAQDYFYLLTSATIALSLAELVVAHSVLGVMYPSDRTGICSVPLVTFAWIVLIDRALALQAPFRLLAAAGILLTFLAIGSFLRGFTLDYYYEWRYDAATKRIFSLLRREHSKNPMKRVRLGVESRLEPSSSFYRDKYRLDWMEEVTMAPPETGGFDYYILTPWKKAVIQSLNLKTIYRDSVSSEILAVP